MPPVPNILLLCENEQSSMLDRRALRDAGYPATATASSGIEAARMLAEMDFSGPVLPFSLVVCSQKLADMDSDRFCAIIRTHPLLRKFPVLVILSNADEAGQIDAMASGASAILPRPYTVDNLRARLSKLLSATGLINNSDPANTQNVDASAFNAALASHGLLLQPDKQTGDHFRSGLKFLHEKKWNYAIADFQRAIANPEHKAEAELGLAAAFNGKGDSKNFQIWLAQATGTLVGSKRWHKARSAYARLLQCDPAAKNPFMTEAHKLIRLNKYDEAATALAESLAIIPKRLTANKIAKTCFMAADHQAMRNALEKALDLADYPGIADLKKEIGMHLEKLSRERTERQRQQAAERKWELARKLGGMPREEAKEAAEPPKPDQPAVAAISNEAAIKNLDDLPEMDFAELNMDENENPADDQILAPLSLDGSNSDMFGKKPKLNEFLSVIKLTWTLARRSRKKND